jgi:hypothetical protein
MSEEKKDNFMDGVYGLILLIAIWQGLGWYNDWKFTPYEIYKAFTHEPTPEEIAERKEKEKEREIEKQRKKEKEKSDLISSLGKNVQNVEYLNLKELALKHITETELQNEETEKSLKGKYIRVTGKLYEIDKISAEYGITKYLVQIVEGKFLFDTWVDGLVTTGSCYATDQSEENKLRNASVGSTLTMVGQVRSYGDVTGLQLRNCTIE